MNDEVVHWNGEGFICAPAGLNIYSVYLWQPEPNGSPPVAPIRPDTLPDRSRSGSFLPSSSRYLHPVSPDLNDSMYQNYF